MKQKYQSKAEKFTFRLTPDQKSKLEKIANREGKKTSEMVRDIVLLEMAKREAA
jgi:predicted DNA-binding protein